MATETVPANPVVRPVKDVVNYFRMMRRDIDSVIERDPAARSTLEILLVYSGLHAIWMHRITHWLWTRNLKLFARTLSQLARWFTGIEIYPGATIGAGFLHRSWHGCGDRRDRRNRRDVTIYQGVTLGGTVTERQTPPDAGRSRGGWNRGQGAGQH